MPSVSGVPPTSRTSYLTIEIHVLSGGSDLSACDAKCIRANKQGIDLAEVKLARRQTRFQPGDRVQVLPWNEVIRTLDERGELEGLPFMPEMLRYCGRQFTVTRRLERTCEDIAGGMRRIRNVVFLDDVRCDGSNHGGCEKGCCFLWKDAWLSQPIEIGECNTEPRYPFAYVFGGDRYRCQSTELLRATEPLSVLDVMSYIRDLKAKTYSPKEIAKNTIRAVLFRIRARMTGMSHQFLAGSCTKTPKGTLNLQAGELVRVKTAREITQTLNEEGKNRGLIFTAGMLPYCGRTFRVLRRLEKMIHEPTSKLIQLEGTVILEGLTCTGHHSVRGGCPKNNYYYWREVWLERV
jgi:hypothetical protein